MCYYEILLWACLIQLVPHGLVYRLSLAHGVYPWISVLKIFAPRSVRSHLHQPRQLSPGKLHILFGVLRLITQWAFVRGFGIYSWVFGAFCIELPLPRRWYRCCAVWSVLRGRCLLWRLASDHWCDTFAGETVVRWRLQEGEGNYGSNNRKAGASHGNQRILSLEFSFVRGWAGSESPLPVGARICLCLLAIIPFFSLLGLEQHQEPETFDWQMQILWNSQCFDSNSCQHSPPILKGILWKDKLTWWGSENGVWLKLILGSPGAAHPSVFIP